MISKEQQDRFKVKLKWQVASKNFRRISRYSYSCFTFKFDIKDQNIMEEFTELVTSDKTALPIEICNFFLNRGLEYTLKYRYIKEAGLKNNWTMFVHVLCLNREKRKVIKKAVGKKWVVRHEFNKKLINGKVRNNFKLEIMNCDKAKVWFIQADSNVWWKPKKIIINSDRAKGTSVGWLFAQIGIMQLNKELILRERKEHKEENVENQKSVEMEKNRLKRKFGYLLILLTLSSSLMGCVGTEVSEVQNSKITELTTVVSKYVSEQLKTNKNVVLEVEDAVVNNPRFPSSLTLVVIVNGKTQFLQVDIGTPDYFPANDDSIFYVDETNPFTYIDTQMDYDYDQYVVISEDGYLKVTDMTTTWFLQYKCDVYLQDVSFGENNNGKHENTQTLEIGK